MIVLLPRPDYNKMHLFYWQTIELDISHADTHRQTHHRIQKRTRKKEQNHKLQYKTEMGRVHRGRCCRRRRLKEYAYN